MRRPALILGLLAGCGDDGGSSPVDAPVGSHYLIVDSFGPGSLGAYELTIEVM